jgi:hypothetical protein
MGNRAAARDSNQARRSASVAGKSEYTAVEVAITSL